MKIATIVTAVALTTAGAAFAADHSSYSDRDTSRHHGTVAERNDNSATHEGFMDRTKRALHRMGQKLRNATHRDHNQTASERNDTRSMGAGADQDSARQHRMDQAYSDYEHKKEHTNR